MRSEITEFADLSAALIDLRRLACLIAVPLRLPIRGNCMLPLFRNGDAALAVPVAPHEIRIGDVLVVSLDGYHVMHRCRAIIANGRGLEFITCGDARLRADPPVPATSVCGRVIARERDGSTVFLDGWRFATVRCAARLPCRVTFMALRLLKRLRRSVTAASRSLCRLRSDPRKGVGA
jgi:hypothetical protein